MVTRLLEATRRIPPVSALVVAAATMLLSGCSLIRPAPLPPTEPARSVVGAINVVSRGPVLFDGPLRELYPCNDGDVVAYRLEGGPRSGELMVSRTFALSKPGDFRIANTFDNELSEALHIRVDGDTVVVVSQVDVDQDVGVTFARPLPIVSVPLYSGVTGFRSPIRIWRPSSGRTMGNGEVNLTLSVQQDRLTDYDRTFASKQAGTFKLMQQVFEVESIAWLTPGLGEVQGRRVQAGTDPERFTLVCARIAGNDVIDCGPFASEIDQ